MTTKWVKFPYEDRAYVYDGKKLAQAWPRLHRGDAEPMPDDPAAIEAWRRFHAGDFARAVDAGLAVGGPGIYAAIKAQIIYATYVEPNEKAKLALFEEAARWAGDHRAIAPDEANAHYLYGLALGRYSQGFSVVKALTQGFGGKIKDALDTAVRLAPTHAEAHTAAGAYHAEVIEKVGALVGGMTYGAKRDKALEHFEQARRLHPESVIAVIEYANGLLRLYGKARLADAEKLYQVAAAATPVDAMERLDVEHARSELS